MEGRGDAKMSNTNKINQTTKLKTKKPKAESKTNFILKKKENTRE